MEVTRSPGTLQECLAQSMGYVREKEKVVRMAMRAFSRHLMDDTRMAFGFSGSHDFIHATASCCGKTLVDASSILNQHLTSSIHTLRKFKAENNSRINEMEERLADETIQICQEAIALGLKAHVVVKVDMTVGQNFFELVSRLEAAIGIEAHGTGVDSSVEEVTERFEQLST